MKIETRMTTDYSVSNLISGRSPKTITPPSRLFPGLIVACALSLLPILSSAGLSQSNFDLDSDNWTVVDWNSPGVTSIVGSYPVVWNSNGGNPGGYISAIDPSGEWFWFSAPSKFLGNTSAAFGGALIFDLFASLSDGAAAVVMLTGNGNRLFFDGNSPSTSFASYSVPLSTSGWRLNDWQSGATPTISEMQGVLGNLNGLYISGDWHNGIESAGLDNVQVVPEPSALALFVFGGLGLALLVGRRTTSRSSALHSESNDA